MALPLKKILRCTRSLVAVFGILWIFYTVILVTFLPTEADRANPSAREKILRFLALDKESTQTHGGNVPQEQRRDGIRMQQNVKKGEHSLDNVIAGHQSDSESNGQQMHRLSDELHQDHNKEGENIHNGEKAQQEGHDLLLERKQLQPPENDSVHALGGHDNPVNEQVKQFHIQTPVRQVPHGQEQPAGVEDVDSMSVTFPKFLERGPPDGPGEQGKGGPWKRENLTQEEQKEWDKGFKHNSFNQFASDRISVHRSLADPRPQICKDRQYRSDLPPCSVVIIFHNEAWSVLLRSVHSLLDRTPPHLLTEIVLVDDKSTMPHLGRPLEKYFADYPKVQVVRSPQRGGLTRARLIGFHHSSSEIVVFLDSHIECMNGWYEPMAEVITNDYRAVTFPLIDVIDYNDLAFKFADTTAVGTVRLKGLIFDWMYRKEVPQDVVQNKRPLDSPTMPGGLFAISRRWFTELGTYDPGLDYWGGENIELSFKTWMCNGSLVSVPCSHIGHIFRRTNPIRWSTNIGYKNGMRVAAVWMDDFTKYAMEAVGSAEKKRDMGDISERLALRNRLHCHNFGWYIKNVLPELLDQIDNTAPYAGEIRSQAMPEVCLDSNLKLGRPNGKAILYACHGQGNNQYWMLRKNGHIKQDEKIYLVVKNNEAVIAERPDESAVWQHDETSGHIVHVPSGQCLQAGTDRVTVTLTQCTNGRWQAWTLTPRNPELLQPINL